jgi:hypothetical protein
MGWQKMLWFAAVFAASGGDAAAQDETAAAREQALPEIVESIGENTVVEPAMVATARDEAPLEIVESSAENAVVEPGVVPDSTARENSTQIAPLRAHRRGAPIDGRYQDTWVTIDRETGMLEIRCRARNMVMLSRAHLGAEIRILDADGRTLGAYRCMLNVPERGFSNGPTRQVRAQHQMAADVAQRASSITIRHVHGHHDPIVVWLGDVVEHGPWQEIARGVQVLMDVVSVVVAL